MSSDKDFAPDLKVRRAMIEQKRDNYKAQGYDFFLERMGAEVQDPGADPRAKKAHQETIKELLMKERNCYAVAAKMQKLLDELPVPDEPSSDGDDPGDGPEVEPSEAPEPDGE